MDEIDRLTAMVVMLSNQVALSQYRLAILENATEVEAMAQLKTNLMGSLCALAEIEPEDVPEEMLEKLDENAAKLVASLNLLRSVN